MRSLIPAMMLGAMLAGVATLGQAQTRPQTRGPVVPIGGERTAPVSQPPNATIMAEPVALMIAAFDANGDARVTRTELERGVAHSFSSIDRDARGSLGYIGFADWAERWLGDRNALPSAYETDSDGDNRISLAELQAQLDFTFARLDRDKDGVLVRSELLTLDAGRRDDRQRRGGPRTPIPTDSRAPQ